MGWSWKLVRVAGIDVYVHATFLLLIAWVAARHWVDEQSVAAVVAGVAFILALFACIVLHEFGHALTARRYGIATRDITLLPIGGVARLDRMPEKPSQELRVALAGPAVNVAIAGVLYAWLWVTSGWAAVSEMSLTGGPFLERLMLVNAFIAMFNLVPAFPMDGGRALRAVLATRMEYTRATQHAAALGQAVAFGFGFLGLMGGNPFLVFIAFFVWIGAAQEASMVQISAALAGIPVRRAMVTDFRTVAPADSLERVVETLLAGAQKDFPVVDGGRVVGIALYRDLPGAIARHGRETPVAEIMQRDFQTVHSHDMLEPAFKRLQACDCRTMPVVDDGHLVGLITMDNMGEFLALQASLGAPGGARRVA